MSIECKDITKQFGSTRALDQVSPHAGAWSYLRPFGQQRCWKKHLAQYPDRPGQLPDQGTVTVDGQPCETTMPPYTKFSWWESRTFSRRHEDQTGTAHHDLFLPRFRSAPRPWTGQTVWPVAQEKNPGTFHWILLHFSPDLRAQRQHAVCYL